MKQEDFNNEVLPILKRIEEHLNNLNKDNFLDNLFTGLLIGITSGFISGLILNFL